MQLRDKAPKWDKAKHSNLNRVEMCRIFLHLHGFISETENQAIKGRLFKMATNQGIFLTSHYYAKGKYESPGKPRPGKGVSTSKTPPKKNLGQKTVRPRPNDKGTTGRAKSKGKRPRPLGQ